MHISAVRKTPLARIYPNHEILEAQGHPTFLTFPLTSEPFFFTFRAMGVGMGNSRAIWKHEVNQADKIARDLIDASRIKLGWRILLLPNFIVDYIRFKKSLMLTRKNFLFTKRFAFNAAKQIYRGENRAEQVRFIEIKTTKLLDKERKGYYTEKIRRKQLQEIEQLIDHYLRLLRSNKNKYAEMIRAIYQSRKEYLSFLNALQKVEQEVIQAAITTMKKGSKQERLNWFGKVEEAFKKARMEEAEKIFLDVS